MRCFLNLLVPAMVLAACGAVLAQTPAYNLGRTPSEEEIRAWDIAIGPAGKELPPGSGTAKEGARIYAQKCSTGGCHGPTGAEGPPFRRLVGSRPFNLNPLDPVKTIDNYWPVATLIWDYINRAMPPPLPWDINRGLPPPQREGSPLRADEIYALTAFLLYQGGIIQESDVIDAKSLPKIQMPNRNGFVPLWPEWKKGETKRPFGYYP